MTWRLCFSGTVQGTNEHPKPDSLVPPCFSALFHSSLLFVPRWLVTPLLASRPTDCLKAYLHQRRSRGDQPVSSSERGCASRPTSAASSVQGFTPRRGVSPPLTSLDRLMRSVNDEEHFDPSPCRHASHWLGAVLRWKEGRKSQPVDADETRSPVKRDRDEDSVWPASSAARELKRIKVEETTERSASSTATKMESSESSGLSCGKGEALDSANALSSEKRRDSEGEMKEDGTPFVGLRPVRTYEGFFKHVVPLLRYLGPSLAYEGETFMAVLAVLTGCAEEQERSRTAAEVKEEENGSRLRSQLVSREGHCTVRGSLLRHDNTLLYIRL